MAPVQLHSSLSVLYFVRAAAQYTPIADPRPATKPGFAAHSFWTVPVTPGPSARPAMYAEGGDCVVNFPKTVRR